MYNFCTIATFTPFHRKIPLPAQCFAVLITCSSGNSLLQGQESDIHISCDIVASAPARVSTANAEVIGDCH
jgi:hypothetical protein